MEVGATGETISRTQNEKYFVISRSIDEDEIKLLTFSGYIK